MELLASKFAPLLDLPSDPVFKPFFIAVNILSVLSWIVSVITQNYSLVDRIWPIEPCVFAWAFLYTAYFFNTETNKLRLFIICLLVTMWAIRLTYNYWRKGGYEWTAEDYRWIHVRKMFDFPNKKLLFNIFNLVFIAFFQIYLLLGLVTPMWFIQAYAGNEPLNILDAILTVSFLAFFAIEVTADQQQWHYQTNKYKWLDAQKTKGAKQLNYTSSEVEEFKRGFLVKGLFRFSRHPNFFAEMCLWWIIYGFSISSQYAKMSEQTFDYSLLLNFSVLATFSLTMLFQGSTDLTEKITLTKYPKYAEYKCRVSRLIPFLIWPSKPQSKQN